MNILPAFTKSPLLTLSAVCCLGLSLTVLPQVHAAEPPAPDREAPPAPEYGQFSEDLLTRSITAEMAAQSGRYQQALDMYVEMARESDNLSIIQRAMRIAATLRNIPLTIEMSERWLAKEPGSAAAAS